MEEMKNYLLYTNIVFKDIYCFFKLSCIDTVSYTHLDVYKRQGKLRWVSPWGISQQNTACIDFEM